MRAVIIKPGESVASRRQADKDKEGPFGDQLQALTQRLFGVIKNSDRLEENKQDPEMTADLYHQLSKVGQPIAAALTRVFAAELHRVAGAARDVAGEFGALSRRQRSALAPAAARQLTTSQTGGQKRRRVTCWWHGWQRPFCLASTKVAARGDN